MTAFPTEYTEYVQKGQDAVKSAFETWTKTIQDFTGKLTPLTPNTDPRAAIDEVFDFAAKVLEVQRKFAKEVVQTTASTGETVQRHLATVAETATQQVKDAVGQN
jgi:hypothetical protein